MAVTQKTFEFKTRRDLPSPDGSCRLDILPQIDGKTIVLLTEVAHNNASSITNAIEEIARQIYEEFLWKTNTEDIIWVEHYDGGSYHNMPDYTETFDEVTLLWDKRTRRFYSPQWKRCTPGFVMSIQHQLKPCT